MTKVTYCCGLNIRKRKKKENNSYLYSVFYKNIKVREFHGIPLRRVTQIIEKGNDKVIFPVQLELLKAGIGKGEYPTVILKNRFKICCVRLQNVEDCRAAAEVIKTKLSDIVVVSENPRGTTLYARVK